MKSKKRGNGVAVMVRLIAFTLFSVILIYMQASAFSVERILLSSSDSMTGGTMPNYEYRCPQCGKFEMNKSVEKRHRAKCPKCNSEAKLVPSVFDFRMK